MVVTDLRVGDIINIKGPTVPKSLWPCYWRVTEVRPDKCTLDGPYADDRCEVRWQSIDPITRKPRLAGG